MARILTNDESAAVLGRYKHPTNYQSINIDDPIDPVTYVDLNGDHLLHIAASRRDLAVVALLLDAGVDVDQLDDMDCTALHYAHKLGHLDVAELLKARGASTALVNRFGKFPEGL